GGRVSTFVGDVEDVRGLGFGPDGRLYGCDKKGIVSYAPDGKTSIRLLGVNCKDIVVTHAGGIYFTEYPFGVVSYLPPGNSDNWIRYRPQPGIVAPLKPNGVCLSPDQSMVYVSDPWGR